MTAPQPSRRWWQVEPIRPNRWTVAIVTGNAVVVAFLAWRIWTGAGSTWANAAGCAWSSFWAVGGIWVLVRWKTRDQTEVADPAARDVAVYLRALSDALARRGDRKDRR